jgi:hypothetical protein
MSVATVWEPLAGLFPVTDESRRQSWAETLGGAQKAVLEYPMLGGWRQAACAEQENWTGDTFLHLEPSGKWVAKPAEARKTRRNHVRQFSTRMLPAAPNPCADGSVLRGVKVRRRSGGHGSSEGMRQQFASKAAS